MKQLKNKSYFEEILENGIKIMGARGGSVVLMNSVTGEIISLASFPKFNPNSRPKTGLNQRSISPQKSGLNNSPRINNQNSPGGQNKPGQPTTKGNRVELVGAPIRRNNNGNNNQINNPYGNNGYQPPPSMPSTQSQNTPVPQAPAAGCSASANGNNRFGTVLFMFLTFVGLVAMRRRAIE